MEPLKSIVSIFEFEHLAAEDSRYGAIAIVASREIGEHRLGHRPPEDENVPHALSHLATVAMFDGLPHGSHGGPEIGTEPVPVLAIINRLIGEANAGSA